MTVSIQLGLACAAGMLCTFIVLSLIAAWLIL